MTFFSDEMLKEYSNNTVRVGLTVFDEMADCRDCVDACFEARGDLTDSEMEIARQAMVRYNELARKALANEPSPREVALDAIARFQKRLVPLDEKIITFFETKARTDAERKRS